MNYNLRRTHLRIWILIVLIAPVFIAISINDRPAFAYSDFEDKRNEIMTYPHIFKEFETSNLNIKLKGDKALVKQLEISIKIPLKSASTTLYYLEGKSKGTYIGALQSKGLYRFPVDNSIRGVVLYDPIKKQDIKQIDF